MKAYSNDLRQKIVETTGEILSKLSSIYSLIIGSDASHSISFNRELLYYGALDYFNHEFLVQAYPQGGSPE